MKTDKKYEYRVTFYAFIAMGIIMAILAIVNTCTRINLF